MMTLPIKNVEEINLIKSWYRKNEQFQNLLMFTLAINTGVELVDLLNLKVKDVKDKYYLSLRKQHSVPLNDEILELINIVIKERSESDYLFANTKGKKYDRGSVFYSFKSVCSELGLSENYSVSSWRKTFAYHYYNKYKDISYLMWLFNQGTVQIAFKFINVEENMNLRFKEGVCL